MNNELIKKTIKRNVTFSKLFSLMEERGVMTIVETGTARKVGNWSGDGQSTILFGDYCKLVGGHLWTVDISLEAIEIAKKVTKNYSKYIDYVVNDSIKFLSDWDSEINIDLLYLDSMTGRVNKEKAADHNLKEAITALPYLHANSIIAIDDSKVKGAKSVPYLQSVGWKVIINNNIQAILVKG